jgi:hypothetical protein
MKYLKKFNVYNEKDKHTEEFKITCEECGWHWLSSQSSKSDLFICHKCGHDNESSYVK